MVGSLLPALSGNLWLVNFVVCRCLLGVWATYLWFSGEHKFGVASSPILSHGNEAHGWIVCAM